MEKDLDDKTQNRINMHRILIGFLLLALMSCTDKSLVYGDTQAIKGDWHRDHTVQFELPEMDSLQSYNLFVNLRNNHEFPYNNIFLLVKMEYPEGKMQVDTLEYRMANPDGTWMGKGIGSIKENILWYKEDFKFEEKGTYKLSIEHAVRKNGEIEGDKYLPGLTDVGFSIKKNN